MTQDEQILQRLEAIAIAELPGATVGRNLAKPARLSPGGRVNILNGDHGEPTIDLSPPTYNYQHRIPIEVVGFPSPLKPAEIIGLLTAPFGRAIALDPSLGGLADYVYVTAADISLVEDDGTDSFPLGEFEIIASYATRHPLG